MMFGALLFDSTLDDGSGTAPPPPAAAPPVVTPQAGLAPLGFLVGGAWVTTAGETTCIERVVWAAEPNFLVSVVAQTVGGQPGALARGYFSFAPSMQCLLSSALSTNGSYTGGYQTAAPDANTWVFAMVVGQGAVIRNVQVTMRHPAADQLVIDQAMQQGGIWVTKSSATYQRQVVRSPPGRRDAGGEPS